MLFPRSRIYSEEERILKDEIMSLLSVIVPCYNEQEAIPFFYEAITKTASEMKERWHDIEFEFLFIDDVLRAFTFVLAITLPPIAA